MTAVTVTEADTSTITTTPFYCPPLEQYNSRIYQIVKEFVESGGLISIQWRQALVAFCNGSPVTTVNYTAVTGQPETTATVVITSFPPSTSGDEAAAGGDQMHVDELVGITMALVLGVVLVIIAVLGLIVYYVRRSNT